MASKKVGSGSAAAAGPKTFVFTGHGMDTGRPFVLGPKEYVIMMNKEESLKDKGHYQDHMWEHLMRSKNITEFMDNLNYFKVGGKSIFGYYGNAVNASWCPDLSLSVESCLTTAEDYLPHFIRLRCGLFHVPISIDQDLHDKIRATVPHYVKILAYVPVKGGDYKRGDQFNIIQEEKIGGFVYPHVVPNELLSEVVGRLRASVDPKEGFVLLCFVCRGCAEAGLVGPSVPASGLNYLRVTLGIDKPKEFVPSWMLKSDDDHTQAGGGGGAFLQFAKSIRKPGEDWQKCIKRASKLWRSA